MFLIAANSDQPPKFNEITPSLVVQPSEQVVIRAEVTLSGTPSVFVSWRHNNATYEDHITEDPICDEAREVRHSNVELSVCGLYPLPLLKRIIIIQDVHSIRLKM